MARHLGPATIIDCPGITNDGIVAHSRRDGCWSCAPFWEKVPVCPEHGNKLSLTGYCRSCRGHYSLVEVA